MAGKQRLLRQTWPDAPILCVDNSADMLAACRDVLELDENVRFKEADFDGFAKDNESFDLVFSNAALHWVGAHEALMPRLAGLLGKGGTLAVQMPHQNKAPSHRVWLSLAQELFPGRAEKMGTPGVMAPVRYEELLAPLGQFRLWETDYYQRLTAEPGSHPVRRFTESTYARPILTALGEAERADLIRRYEEVMHTAYPVRADGTVLFPFRRLFFTLTV